MVHSIGNAPQAARLSVVRLVQKHYERAANGASEAVPPVCQPLVAWRNVDSSFTAR